MASPLPVVNTHFPDNRNWNHLHSDDPRDWARAGMAIFPVGRASKVPLTEHGCLDASTDPEQIDAWLISWRDCNWGWALRAPLFAVDIDPRHGGDTEWLRLQRANGAPQLTLRQRTGGGGSQWFYTAPTSVRITNRVAVAPGIDVRSDGGYVVIAPSIHPSGNRYRWDSFIAPQMAPAWLIDLVAVKPEAERKPYTPPATCNGYKSSRRQRYAQRVLELVAEEVANAPEGSRNDTLNRSWFRCAQFKDVLNRAEVQARLLAAAAACGLSEREALRVLR